MRSVFLSGLLVAAACGGDDDAGDASGPSDDTTTTPTSMTSAPATTDDASEEGSTTGDSTTGDPNDDTTTGDPADDTTTEGDDETEGTTTGIEVCEIDLPPPGACDANAPLRPMPLVRGAGPRSLSGVDQLIAPPELEQDDHDETTTGGFIDPGDPSDPANECDIWAQDCPEGQKCMPWDNSGQGSWNATKCTPLDPNPNGVGDPCTVEGSGVSGIDDCDIGSMCWGVDAETNMGHCIELCSCSEANPICETPNTFCSITNSGVLPLCLPVCNPLDPEACSASEGCYPIGEYFVCAPNASAPNAGNAGDPCEFLNLCNHGLMCGWAAGVPGCAGSSGCCTAFCTLGDDSPCLNGQSCVPFYDEGQAPDACLGEVGVCIIPS